MQVCTSLQTDNHASIPPASFYRPDALLAAHHSNNNVAITVIDSAMARVMATATVMMASAAVEHRVVEHRVPKAQEYQRECNEPLFWGQSLQYIYKSASNCNTTVTAILL